jgi:putative oxidoreductase
VARAQRYIFTVLRVYLGAFNFASGINYFFLVWPQPIPADPTGAAYMSVTLHLGMFQLAKVLETLGGLCLISDMFVPLALIFLFPVTVNVLIMNVFFSPLAHVRVSGARNFVFHVLLLAGYARYYFPLLTRSAPLRPLWGEPRPDPTRVPFPGPSPQPNPGALRNG